jgi:hypothetical protein
MKRQEFVTGSTARGQFLVSQQNDADTSSQTAYPVAPNRSRFADALKLRRFLMLLLCRRKQQHRRPSRKELTLPRGCALAVRYSSR